MGKALYRDYRPKSLAEVVGQEQITVTLRRALETGKISHAYLFTGPRGVGKTSIARILAHEINGLEYTDDSAHLDIIEIDAASNRRIDEIRDLRDKVNIAPTSAKYKVYIIDEVHMLTREAFNALLKTLEEPPAHAVFVLATTEVHKLPETIISRTQRFTFRPYPLEQVAAHLKELAKKEKIDIDDEALALIAAHGEGSFRDSISLLDQTRGHDGKVDADYVRQLIGVPTDEAIAELFASLQSHDAAAAHQTLEKLRTQGFSSAQTAKSLSKFLRDRMLRNEATTDDFALLQNLLDVPTAHDPDAFLELTLLECALAPITTAMPASTPKEAVKLTAPGPKKPEPAAPQPAKKAKETPKSIEDIKPEPEAPPAAPEEAQTAEAIIVDSDLWPQALSALKSKYNTLYGVARMARPEVTSDKITLYFKFGFHKKRLSEAKNHAIITDILQNLTGHSIALHCELETTEIASAAPAVSATKPAASGADDSVATISNIFGGAELLES